MPCQSESCNRQCRKECTIGDADPVRPFAPARDAVGRTGVDALPLHRVRPMLVIAKHAAQRTHPVSFQATPDNLTDPPLKRQGDRIRKRATARGSYPSPLWDPCGEGGWPKFYLGQSGGGRPQRKPCLGLPPPRPPLPTMLRIASARPTLPTRGRDRIPSLLKSQTPQEARFNFVICDRPPGKKVSSRPQIIPNRPLLIPSSAENASRNRRPSRSW